MARRAFFQMKHSAMASRERSLSIPLPSWMLSKSTRRPSPASIGERERPISWAAYADKILKGTKPSEILVEQPTKFEFLINLKTAKKLGLQVPLRLQQIADQIIE